MDLPAHQSTDECSYADINTFRMYGMVYLATTLPSSILGVLLSQLFCIKKNHIANRERVK